jgi:Na+-translocating ferredoxin:NAD+ oxidoreductase RnfG subunit
MTRWIKWTTPAALVVAASPSAYAVQYLTIAQARQQAFPSASFSEVQAGRIWRAEAGGKLAGFFIFDRVIGKHLYIDYTVALDSGGRVQRVDILEYRESYGGEIRSPSWLAQFVGKSNTSALQVGKDIRNISGATLSSQHVTEGIKRIMAIAPRLK